MAYLGIPLVSADGHALGSFCVMDSQPRRWTEEEVETLQELTASVLTEIELRLVAQAAERENAEWQALVDSSIEAIFGIDADGRCSYINPAALDLLGYEAHECLGRNMHELTHYQRPDGSPYPLEECPVYRAFTSGRGARLIEETLWRKDGTSVPALYSCSPILANGRVVGGVVTVIDVTEPRRAEEKLRFQSNILQNVRDSVIVTDLEGRITYWNDGATAIFGYSADEMLGRSPALLYPGQNPEQLAADLAGVLAGDDYASEWQGRRKDGSVVWVDIKTTLMQDPEGRALGFIGVAKDITERKRAEEERVRLLAQEQAARAEAEKLAAERTAILGQIADAVIITDPLGRITFVNEAARRLHGVAKLGVPVEGYTEAYHLVTPDGQPYPPAELPLARAVQRGETIVNAEWRIRRPDGREITAHGSAAPVVAEDGTQFGAVLTARDVTAQRDFERQREEFLATAAHDLKNPLAAIKGHAQLLHRRATRDPERARDATGLATIEAQVEAMRRLIDQLLDTARRQMGKEVPLRREEVDLVELTERLVEQYAVTTNQHAFRVQGAGQGALVGCWDADRLEQVLGNLLTNAIKYSPAGGTITVSLTREEDSAGDWAILEVRDQGVGIPAADLPRVFTRFHRARNVAGRIPGLGIGLAGAQSTVGQHGGRISVESREGIGSAFTVRLPL